MESSGAQVPSSSGPAMGYASVLMVQDGTPTTSSHPRHSMEEESEGMHSFTLKETSHMSCVLSFTSYRLVGQKLVTCQYLAVKKSENLFLLLDLLLH